MPTVNYTAGSIMLWAYLFFCAGGPGHLVQIHGIMNSSKYKQIKNLNLTASARNLIMGRGWIFQQEKIQNKQNQHKTVSLNTKWSFSHDRPSSHIRWVSELKRRSANMDLGICRIWRGSVWRNALISRLIIRHYRRNLRAVILAKSIE